MPMGFLLYYNDDDDDVLALLVARGHKTGHIKASPWKETK